MQRVLHLVVAVIGLSCALSIAADPSCDANAYAKVINACFTGRATGFALPDNKDFGTYSGELTTAWDLGPYDTAYLGSAFTPSGAKLNPKTSVLPPYNWGAVGQICDIKFDPLTHETCAKDVHTKLVDKTKNAEYADSKYYWMSHGHNCHDAAEDVATCLNNATPGMQQGCGFDVRIVVWDSEPDVNRALGNVYHSQVLVKRMRKDTQVVCLAESQVGYPSGDFDDNCCTTNLKIFEGGTGQEMADAFSGCSVNFASSSVNPHVYEAKTFRARRQTGAMDAPTSYNRNAGLEALNRTEMTPLSLGPQLPPQIVSVIYDEKGNPLALNIR